MGDPCSSTITDPKPSFSSLGYHLKTGHTLSAQSLLTKRQSVTTSLRSMIRTFAERRATPIWLKLGHTLANCESVLTTKQEI